VGARLAAAVHIDSGMNRLGLSAAEVEAVAGQDRLWSAFELVLVMSHLACADDAGQPKNAVQRDLFERLRQKLPEAPASLANSAGILLGSDYVYDLVRPGVALYGGHPRRKGENPFRHVVRLDGRIVQLRDVEAGETIGYGATRTLQRPSRIATVAAGYADGLFRLLSAGDDVDGLSVFVGPQAAPILGRVSMDLITIDVTGIPEHLARRGAWVELIGPNVTAQTHAARVGTIDYEVLTNLGLRALRRYIGG
jgi:alanine racemase